MTTTNDLAQTITDYLCEQEYDIGGRAELLKHVSAALAARESRAQPASVPDQWRKDVQTLIAYGVAFEPEDGIEVMQAAEYDEAADRLTTMLNQPRNLESAPDDLDTETIAATLEELGTTDGYDEDDLAWAKRQAGLLRAFSNSTQKPSAYCRACQGAGMSNCQHFDECSGATCATCHRPFNQPAQPASVAEQPLPIETAPRDGTMVRLLVDFTEHATEDTAGPAWTIGANNDDNVGDDERVGWLFAGWCWTHDHFTQGEGTPIGWLPMIAAAPQPAKENTGVVYSAAQLILHSSAMLHHPPADDDRSAVTFWLPKSTHRREEMAQAFERIATIFRTAPAGGLD